VSKEQMRKKPDILSDDESLKNEAPLLHSIVKDSPFSVPENYFDSLPSEIIEKCRTGVAPKKWGEGILSILLGYKWKVLCTVTCLTALCFFVIKINNRPISYEAIAQNIPDSLIVQHLDNNITYINESTLEDLQDDESNISSVKNNSDSTNADQDIIAYLIDHNVNVSDIETENQ
jgi:hypothetical protein